MFSWSSDCIWNTSWRNVKFFLGALFSLQCLLRTYFVLGLLWELETAVSKASPLLSRCLHFKERTQGLHSQTHEEVAETMHYVAHGVTNG